jgi:hypothetical protein
MAENERLDVLKNPRWLRVMRFIASGPKDGEIPRRLTEAMYRTLRSVGKQIPLQELLKAADVRDPALSAAVAQCRHDFAEMVERVAAEPAVDGAPTVSERYVDVVRVSSSLVARSRSRRGGGSRNRQIDATASAKPRYREADRASGRCDFT